MNTRIRLAAIAISCCLALILTSNQAHAQFMGHNAKGDFGLTSGSQPPPGFYLAGMYYRYDGETLRDRIGNSIAIDPEEEGSLDANAYALGAWCVTDLKLFGGNYGFMIFPALTNNKFEVPILSLQEKVSTGFTDTYVQPINLGWQKKQADILAGIGVYIPTGRYSPDASDNLGMGMWSFELFAGTTLYFDEEKTWNFATTAYYETHTKKKDSDIKVGDILTLEGGLGKSFMDGGVNVGLAYYAQWKLSLDDFGELTETLQAEIGEDHLPKHRVFGFGPDVTIPIASSTKLIAMLNARYFWETGARTTLQGRTLVITATFPIPSVSLE